VTFDRHVPRVVHGYAIDAHPIGRAL
jgi:hypothetical protein